MSQWKFFMSCMLNIYQMWAVLEIPLPARISAPSPLMLEEMPLRVGIVNVLCVWLAWRQSWRLSVLSSELWTRVKLYLSVLLLSPSPTQATSIQDEPFRSGTDTVVGSTPPTSDKHLPERDCFVKYIVCVCVCVFASEFHWRGATFKQVYLSFGESASSPTALSGENHCECTHAQTLYIHTYVYIFIYTVYTHSNLHTCVCVGSFFSSESHQNSTCMF